MDCPVYENTFKIEVTREYGTAISAAFYRHALTNGINSENHPVNKASSEAWQLADRLYTSTNEQIESIKARLDELKNYLLEVNPNAVI